ncbi:MAG TPA: hypothetical protein VLH79_10640 [Chthonomonadales bacterium]|nr:hypothetical protein [Chthonomonadales bacterium]
MRPLVMRLRSERTALLASFTYWAVIYAAPRPFGHEEGPLGRVRVEDLLFPFVLAYVLRNLGRVRALLGGKLAFAMLVWLSWAFLTTVLNAVFRGFPIPITLAFFGKELQYCVFLAAMAIWASISPRAAVGPLAAMAVVVIAGMAYQVVTLRFLGYYGVALPFDMVVPGGVAASPSENGSLCALLVVGSFALAVNHRAWHVKWRWALPAVYGAVAGSIAAVLLVGSRSGIAGAFGALAAVVLWRALTLRIRPGALAAYGVIAVVVAVMLTVTGWGELAARRFGPGAREVAVTQRVQNWLEVYDSQTQDAEARPWSLVVGLGLASPNLVVPSQMGSMTLNVDNQYVRRLFEVGLGGAAVWMVVLGLVARRTFALSRRSPKRFLLIDAMVGALTAAALIGMGLEVLQVARSSAAFYGFMGLLLGTAYHEWQQHRATLSVCAGDARRVVA